MSAPRPAADRARTPLERAPRPRLGHEPIPVERYRSPGFARLERERLWPRVWLLAGFESDLAAAGDWFTFEIAGESVLVVRQPDGGLVARHNVCMHRGNRLVEPGRGRAARFFTCGYHAWRYGLDGRLEAPQDPQSFPQGCPHERLDLRPVRCDTWGGFVWVCLDPDAEPLRAHLGPLPEHLDPYHFEEMSIVGDVTLEIDCNWKTSLDAFNEAYHIAGTHPDTLPVNDDVNVPIDCYERHTRMILKLAVPSPRLSPRDDLHELVRDGFLRTAGIDPDRFEGGPGDVRPAIVKAIREVQGPALGADFSELHDTQLVDDFHYTVFPNVTLNVFGRNAWLFRHRPHPTDPERMLFDFFNLVRAPAAGLARAAHEHHVATDDLVLQPLGGGGELLAQDTRNLPRVQAGMRSSAFTGLHLGDQEIRIRHFHHTLDRFLDPSNTG